MKFSLPFKLGIAVIAVFGLLILGMMLWKPMRVRYYSYRLHSGNIKTRQYAAKELLRLGTGELTNEGTNRPVLIYYTDRYNSKGVKKRIAVVEELCDCGDRGKELMRDIFRTCRIKAQVRVPAGNFVMGSSKGESNERPAHKVTLSAFHMDKYEVTNEKFHTFVKATGHNTPPHWKSGEIPKGLELHPVVTVTWDDAKAYADWLGMRLPMEAEWEYACRAGSTTMFCFGDNISKLGKYAWCNKNSGHIPQPVGRKQPNKWGLYDMHGNVWEWCNDWYSGSYYRTSPENDPQGPPRGSYHVHRGNKFAGFKLLDYRSAYRGWDPASYRGRGLGFRCVRDIK
ncbi:MAG: formylglycine-generating enzyme family protein [Planctomycetota bacterium]|nr:MAG: formylglycine-generating enzyme family protein [Planctomycetota bacterium]